MHWHWHVHVLTKTPRKLINMAKAIKERRTLLKEIANRIVALTFREQLGLINVDNDASKISWYPTWTFKEAQSGKALKKIVANFNGGNFIDIPVNEINYMGLSENEIVNYLKMSDAQKINPTLVP